MITIHPTTELMTFHGCACRIWRGITSQGTPCYVFVAMIGVDEDAQSPAIQAEMEAIHACAVPFDQAPGRLQ